MPQFYTILLIGAWVLGSGVVAYISDNLGRKLGKKRLSLWGLRPRHTAMVMTMLTGMGIAILTVGLVALVNVNARRALFTYVQEISSLSEKEESLQQTNRQLEKRNRDAEYRAHQSEANAATAHRQEGVAAQKATLALRQLNRVQKQRDQVEKRLTSARVRLGRLETSRRQLVKEVRERQQRMAVVTQQLAVLNVRLRDALVKVNQSRRLLAQTQDQLKLARTAYQLARTEYQQAQNEAKRLETQIKADKQTLTQVQSDLAQTNQDLTQAKADLADIQKIMDTMTASATVIRASPVTFPMGQEIARRVIYRPDNVDEVKAQIIKLLDAADQEAQSQGADSGDNGTRSVILVPVEYPINDKTWIQKNEEDQIIQAAQEISDLHQDVVVRVLAAANSVQGEPVQASLELLKNRLVFHRGQIVAERDIDGSLPDFKVLESLIDMLQNQVRGEALKAGLLPPPSGSLGEIDWEQVVHAMNQLRAMNGSASVQVITQADVWTADPLLVRFVLQT